MLPVTNRFGIARSQDEVVRFLTTKAADDAPALVHAHNQNVLRTQVRSVPVAELEEALDIHVRWMIRRDMPEVLSVEREAFEFSWSEEDFTRCLRQRNCIGMVAEMADSVVAFMIYELHRTRLHVLNFAVTHTQRRKGIGSRMMEKVAGKLTPDRRNRVLLEVRETNLPAQLFFRKNGFRAVSVLKDFYQDSTEDAYLMQYLCEAVSAVSNEEIKRAA